MATNYNITEPPEFLRSYYAALADRGMNLGNLGFTAYTQPRIAPWNTQQNAAAQMVQTRALNGSPAMDAANTYYQNTLNGRNANPYAGSNPYLQNSINTAMDDVSGRINSQFNGNAFGGTAHQQTLARELGNISSNMRMQDYTTQQGLAENQLNRQQNALSFAPTLAANDYADAQALMGVGNQLQGYNQQVADANYQEFMRKQDYPGQQLSYMQAGLNPSTQAFRSTTSVSPDQGSNGLAGAIGGGLAGYGVGSYFNNPWLGAAIGAGAGLLGGR